MLSTLSFLKYPTHIDMHNWSILMLLSLGTQQAEDVKSNNIDGAVDEHGNKRNEAENNHTCIDMNDDIEQAENNSEQSGTAEDNTREHCDGVDGAENEEDGEGVKRALMSDTGAGSSNTLTNEGAAATGGSSSTVATITPVSSNSTNS